MIIGFISPVVGVEAKSGWNSDSTGWFYYNSSGSYYHGQWANIGGSWYYFTSDGYMDYSEYRNGCWLGSDGVWNTNYSNGTWKCNSTGWWYEDGSWYPAGQWLWIDGCCYYFGANGYMETNCFRDGCWLSGSGAWDSNYSDGAWKYNGVGWYYEAGGWCPANQGLWIDGSFYWFDENGYYNAEMTEQNRPADDNNGNGGNNDGNGNGGSGNNGDNGNSDSGKSDNGNGNNDNNDEYADLIAEVSKYRYEVIPLVGSFNEWYYIKTDNPNPYSFLFVDESSRYGKESISGISSSSDDKSIKVYEKLFPDVVYEDESTFRVSGGYLAHSEYLNIDGGELTLMASEYPFQTASVFAAVDTNIKVTVPELYDKVDYLIQTYGDSDKSFFDNMDSIEDGLKDICFYLGIYIPELEEKRDGCIVNENGKTEITGCYYGISSSIHYDQGLDIESPYVDYRTELFLSTLYPFRADSLGFPAIMKRVAYRMNSSVTLEEEEQVHYIIYVTLDGVTKVYGGQGKGGNVTIDKSQIAETFDFKNFNAATDVKNLSTLANKIKAYEGKDLDVSHSDELTWDMVFDKIGTSGNYIRIKSGGGEQLVDDKTYKIVKRSFNYLYKNEDNICAMSNTWFEGRYYNGYEYFEEGATFDKTIDNQPVLAFKDFKLELKDADRYGFHDATYRDPESNGYNAKTGTWNLLFFEYNEDKKVWECKKLLEDFYDYEYNYDTGDIDYYYYKDHPVYGAAFVDACTITLDEAKAMKLDANTSTKPTQYYIYDMTTAPGTAVGY